MIATAHLAANSTTMKSITHQRAANQQDIFIDGGECQNVINSRNLQIDDNHLRVSGGQNHLIN
jgi:hypothetical protein